MFVNLSKEAMPTRPMLKSAIMIATLLSCLSLFAENVAEVKYEQENGNKVSIPQTILDFNVKTHPGMPFNRQVINDDVKRLMATGLIEQVDVDLSNKDELGNVIVKFIIHPKPMIKSVRIEGCKKFTTNDLREKIKISPETPLNDNALNESLKEIRNFYIEKGYHAASVTPSISKTEENEVDVIFVINEGLRLKVNEVTFEGNTLFYNYTLKHAIANQYSIGSHFFNTGLYQSNEIETDKIRIRELYWNEGYLDFVVKEVQINELQEDPEWVNINFVIDEGSPYRVQSLKITGNEKFLTEDLMGILSLQENEIFDNRLERKDIESLKSKYYELGHDNVYIQAVRIPDTETHQVIIEYRITEGSRDLLRNVTISGNEKTKYKVIRRELDMLTGDPLDRNKIEKAKKRLLGMGLFSEVQAYSAGTEEPGMKDLDLKVKERDYFKLSLGGGFSDSLNIVGMLTATHRNFDLFNPSNNFEGGGQIVSAHAMYGTDIYDFGFNFTEPWLFDQPYSLSFSAWLKNHEFDHWSEQYAGGEISLSRKLDFIFDEYTSLSLGFLFQQVRVWDMSRNMSETFRRERGNYLQSMPSITLAHNTLDNMLYPTEGHDISLFTGFNARFLGSSENYLKLEAKAVQYFNFFEKFFIGHVGAKIGMVPTIGETKRTPIYDRYFLGSSGSVRGFPYRSIGPTDEDDRNYGGQSMFTTTLEITHPMPFIGEYIRGAIFVDAGNSSYESERLGFDKINVGAGYGFRIFLPNMETPLKLDFAYPIVNNADRVHDRIYFHFDISLSY